MRGELNETNPVHCSTEVKLNLILLIFNASEISHREEPRPDLLQYEYKCRKFGKGLSCGNVFGWAFMNQLQNCSIV